MRAKKSTTRGRIAVRLLTVSALAAGFAIPTNRREADADRGVDRYYMVIYSAEAPGDPTRSHCFATFARLTASANDSTEPRIELHHINWFSVRGHHCGATFGLVECDGRPTRPEPGENRTTRDALELVQEAGRRVTRWGPYEIDRSLYDRALEQIDLLEGRVAGRTILYKAIDLGYRNRPSAPVLNCIHAVSDIVREPAPLRTWTTYGDEAARRVVRHLSRWIKPPARDEGEVWNRIWTAIWNGAPAQPEDALVRADLATDPPAVAGAGRNTLSAGSLTLTEKRESTAAETPASGG